MQWVCVSILKVKQPAQTRAHGFWAHHHLSVGGLTEESEVLGVVPARLLEHPVAWSVSEPLCYTQIAQKEPNLLGDWEQCSCVGTASCSNTAPFQGGSLATSTWHNTGYKQVCHFRVRALEKTSYALILYVGFKKKNQFKQQRKCD